MCALCWQTEGGLTRRVGALASETPARLLRTGGAGGVVMTAKCVWDPAVAGDWQRGA